MEIFYILLGGFIGGSLRFTLSNSINHSYKGRFPLGTFVVNCLGSGLFAASLSYNWLLIDTLFTESFIFVGLLGSFTTFSAFCLEGYQLVMNEQFAWAFLYLVGTTACALLGFILVFITSGGL
jgi:CrcB protein